LLKRIYLALNPISVGVRKIYATFGIKIKKIQYDAILHGSHFNFAPRLSKPVLNALFYHISLLNSNSLVKKATTFMF
jgi:hypothetical protein